jgi:hypothetical protein
MYRPPTFSIEPTEILAGSIAIYKNAWINPEKDILTIDKVAEDSNSKVSYEDAKLHYGKDDLIPSNHRTNKHFSLTDAANVNEELRLINNKFFELTFSAVKSYKQTLGIQEPIYWNEPCNVLKYQTGQEYKSHYDGNTETKRSISPIVYLNSDFTGGEIEFVNFNLTIKPEPGMLLLFPSNYAYTHIAHPVKTGTKYAIVTWLHDRP